MQAGAQALLEVFIGGLPGAVPGIKYRTRTLHGCGHPGKLLRAAACRVQPCTVEPAHEHIRPEPVKQVAHAFVRTAAEQHPPPVFFRQQVDLVAEILRLQHAVFHDLQPACARRIALFEPCGRDELERITERDGCIRHIDKPPGMPLQRRVQPDVFFRPVVMRLKRMAAQIQRRCPVQRQKTFQPAAMVVMPVGEHRRIHRSQVHPQRRRVGGKRTGLAGVQQNAAAGGLDIQAQAVFCGKSLRLARILQ